MPVIKIIPPPGIVGVFWILKKFLNNNEHFGEEIICFSCPGTCPGTARKAVPSLFFPVCSALHVTAL